jgi:hypothetical protein
MLQLIALAVTAAIELFVITCFAAYGAGRRAGLPARGAKSPLAVTDQSGGHWGEGLNYQEGGHHG